MNKVFVIRKEMSNDGEVISSCLKPCYTRVEDAIIAMEKAMTAEKEEWVNNHPDYDFSMDSFSFSLADKMGNDYVTWNLEELEVKAGEGITDTAYLKTMIRQECEALINATKLDDDMSVVEAVMKSIKGRIDSAFDDLYGKGC